MGIIRNRAFGLGLSLFLVAHAADAQATGRQEDSVSVAQTIERFHDALARGDSASAAGLLHPTLTVLESGELETRASYLGHHLGADIAFARAVPSRREVQRIDVRNDAAWFVATSRTTGEYQGRPIDSDGAELMVLTRSTAGWQIAAIHWSSRRHRP